MRQILATLRLILFMFVLLIGTPLVLLFGLLPVRTQSDARLATLPVGWMAKAFLWIFNIRLHCPEPEKIRAYAGLIVCNHLSYADVVLLLGISPVRFLAAAGVGRIPFIGWVATAIETVFVNRGNQASRDQARQALAQKLQAQASPPIAIFPEGKISDGTGLLPFRHGAFEIAMASGVSVLPCAIQYSPLLPIHYYGEDDSLPKAIWRLAVHPGGVDAQLIPTETLESRANLAVEKLADESWQAIAGPLGIDA